MHIKILHKYRWASNNEWTQNTQIWKKGKKCIFVIGSESFIASFMMSHTQTMLDGK